MPHPYFLAIDILAGVLVLTGYYWSLFRIGKNERKATTK